MRGEVLVAGLGAALSLCLIAVPAGAQPGSALAPSPQQSAPTDPKSPAKTTPPQETPHEVGGRLLITGETVVVVADPDRPAAESSIATKTDTPLLETPRSISVTDQRTLEDRVAVAIADAHDYTVGVTTADDRGPAFARGFRIDFYDLRRDGLRTYAWSVREPVGIERVQYLRGPAAVLYGDGSPGGLVNLVLKKPLPVQRSEVTAGIGTTGFKRFTGDVTGPIGAGTRWRYRLVGAAEGLDGGFDNDERRLSLLPMLAVDLTDGVTLNVDSEIYHQRGRNYRHTIPATSDTQQGDFSRIPWTLNVASPDDRWSGWNVSPGARLDARLGTRASLHASARYTRIGGDLDVQTLLGIADGGRAVNRYAYREISRWDELQSDTFAVIRLTTGRLAHTFVSGFEAGRSTTDSLIGTGPAAPLDLDGPTYAARAPAPSLSPIRYDVLRLGAYLQDQITPHPAVRIVPALRWSRLSVEDTTGAAAIPDRPADAVDSDATAVSPSLGVVWMPGASWSVYATAGAGFEPPTPGQYRADGRPLAPADSRSLEGGIKVQGFGGRLAATGAVFGIRRTNVSEADGRGSFTQIAEGRSHGIETELTGGIAPGLGVQAAYAWTRTEIARDASGFAGHELPNAPRHAASAWLRYTLPPQWRRGMMLAGGVVYVSDRYVAGSNTTVAPAYIRVDLSGSYRLVDGLALRIGVHNLANVRYVTTGAGSVLFAGSARRIIVQLTAGF